MTGISKTSIPVNDLTRSWLATSPAVHEAIGRVVRRGYFILGPEGAAYEQELAMFLEGGEAIGVASGTDALALALQACGCRPGDEVVVAGNAGGYASVAAIGISCTVAIADVDADTALVTESTISAAIGPKTSAVVVTHLYGNIAPAASIRRLCDSKGVALVEDCAQAIGGYDRGERVGLAGHAAAFSFYPTKNLGGVGDGGAVVTTDPEIGRAIRSLRQYGWGGRYDIRMPGGRNSRLDELQAAVLRLGLPMVDDLNAVRRGIVKRFAAAIDGSWARMITGADNESVAHLAVIAVPDRDRVQAALGQLGIGTDVHYPVPDHRQPAFESAIRPTDAPTTDRLAIEVLTIPCFPDLTEDELRRIEDGLRTVLT